MSYQPYIEAFEIFDKYDHFKEIHAEHDEIYAGPDPEALSNEDMNKIIELGWLPDNENGCFYKFV